MKNATKPRRSSSNSAAARLAASEAPFDSTCSRRREPIRAGEVVRKYVELLAARSGLPLVQQDLFDKNPGPWQFDDEDHVKTFQQIWDHLVALNPRFGRPNEMVRLTPDELKRLAERCYQGGVEATIAQLSTPMIGAK